MVSDPQRQQVRQQRLRSDDPSVNPPLRKSQPLPPEMGTWAVLREVDVTAGRMMFQRFSYERQFEMDNQTPPMPTTVLLPPEIGKYEAFGVVQRCYPLPTANYEMYVPYEWPEKLIDEAGVETDNPITTATIPILISQERSGFFVAQIAFKIEASILDPTEEVNECSFG